MARTVAQPSRPTRCRARRLLAAGAVALAAHGPCWGRLAQSDMERLFKSIADTQESTKGAHWASCLAVLDQTAALAKRTWGHTYISWFATRIRCEARVLQSRGEPITAETVARLAAPGLAHLAQAPAGVERRTGARVQLLAHKWQLMRDLGLQEDAAAEELQLVQALLEADRTGQNPTVREDLDRWAHDQYGKHPLLPQIETHLRWISARYGPEHRTALILRRAVAFAYRSADSSAEALAVMDEAARLARLHHPNDKNLQITMAGERAPCLAQNGLLLEARDEFIVLRDGMLERTPLDHGNLMRMNYHLAAIAKMLGDYEQAEAFADAADHHARQSSLPNDRVEVAVAHVQRAEARVLRGVPGAADELRRELERNTPDDGGTGEPAFTLAKLGYRNADAELLAWAQDFLQRHAQRRLQPLQPSRALVEIAHAWAVSGSDPARAHALLERALARSLSGRDLGVGVQSAFAMARQLAPSQPEAAVWWFKRGANTLQALRQRGQLAQDADLHRATLADHEADLRAFVALLIDEGRYLEAREALRVLREEELHDFTRRSRQRASGARAAGLGLTARERGFERALAPIVERMQSEQTLADARARPAPLETHGFGWLDDPVTEAMLDRTQGELRTVLQAPQPPARARDVAPWRPALPPGTAHLQYFVRDARLDILVTTAGGAFRHSVPVQRIDLNRRTHAWRAALTNPAADALAGAREFHALLVQPVQARLGGIRELRVSLDGALRYLPMAALHDGQRYLTQRYRIVMDDGVVARAGGPATQQAPSSGSSGLHLAAFGRTAPDAAHAALPGVDAELKTVAGLAVGQGPAAVRVLQDAAFTAQALQDTLAAAPNVVHIASHFHLAAAEEESSYLLLGDGQRLPLSRLAQMPWDRVRLVLLSACDSAVGDTSRHGREFNGLAGVLRQAGAGNVLASLWPIADASTASFMREFYRPMATAPETDGRVARQRTGAARPIPEPSWLSQAQRRWLARHASGAQAHPYHWAAFAWWSSSAKQGPDRGGAR